jgi:transcriptional regulator with XRE-family HTH domain
MVAKRSELGKLTFADAAEMKLKIGKLVRDRRQALKMSQTELARQTGVSDRQIGNIEWARNFPSMSVYIVICRVLGIESEILK